MLVSSFDLIYTTFAPRGAGPISGTVTATVWNILFSICKLVNNRRVLGASGILIVLSILVTWVMLLWAGNTLIFLSDKEAVVSSETGLPANVYERIYFAGYNLSTMGNGDFKAGTNAFLIYTAFISFSGLIAITIAISYMVPVLSAVTQRRALSIRIASIGHSPQAMLLNNWNGEDFKMLETQFSNLAETIALQGQMHYAYPVLHYFHNNDKETALLPNLAILDEAVSLLLLYIPEEQRPGAQYLFPLRMALTSFLSSLTSTFIDPDDIDSVPPMKVDELQEKQGLYLLDPDMNQIKQLNYRRKTLKAMIENNGWYWDEISAPVLEKNFYLPNAFANE